MRLHPGGVAQAQSPTAVACRHAEAVHGGFLIYLHQTDLHVTIRRGVELSFNTHLIWSYYTSLPHPYTVLAFSTILELARAIKEGLAPWGKRKLGMNIMKISIKVMLSYHKYSSAYELD